MQKSKHLLVEFRIIKNTTARELINVIKDCHCVTHDW